MPDLRNSDTVTVTSKECYQIAKGYHALWMELHMSIIKQGRERTEYEEAKLDEYDRLSSKWGDRGRDIAWGEYV